MKVNEHMFVAGLKVCLIVICVGLQGAHLYLDQKHNFNGLAYHTCQIDNCKVLKPRHTFLI